MHPDAPAVRPKHDSITSWRSSRSLMTDDGDRPLSYLTPMLENSYGGVQRPASSVLSTGEDGKPAAFPTPSEVEADDWLHQGENPKTSFFSVRALANFGCLGVLIAALLMLFAGYPIIVSYHDRHPINRVGSFNLGGVNGTGQYPVIGNFRLIDEDTPASAHKITPHAGGEDWELVFSDEFEVEGRSFNAGDDPYWEAVDLHAWATGDLEYYDPRAVTTRNGSLELTLSDYEQNNLSYTGAEISSWNKFCFTGGRVEAAVRLPGRSDVYGLWPAVWTMGNLGRVGYGSSLDGLWPYSYDSCDVGTLPNQTTPDGLPAAALTASQESTPVSFLAGQRLSRCTCPNDKTHPGPKHKDGTWVGRSAPEIDLIEAQVDNTLLVGEASQSCQFAPFNPQYKFLNESNAIFHSPNSKLNTYSGGQFQQSASGLTETNENTYEYLPNGQLGSGFAVYAYEYEPGSDGYITWVSDDKPSWTYKGAGMAANAVLDVGSRPVPMEPMYIIINLAISEAFGAIDYKNLKDLYPVHMYVDYVRVYQDPSKKNVGCDPDTMPTASYIARYPEAYSNYNLTIWEQLTDDPKPYNKLVDTC